MAEYQRNPIGYDMHKRELGVLVRWEDLRADGDKVYGKPVINLNHPNGQKTVEDIENGFINAASVGHIVALELSSDPADMLPNQKGPTVSKWFNRECSLVDIPGNFNALKLFDKDENEINLADFSNKSINIMKQIFFTPAQLVAMKLSADADDAQVTAAFNDLVAKAAKADGLQTQLNDLHAQVSKDKVEAALKAALDSKKITKELSDKLRMDYATKPKELEDLIAAMPAYSSVSDQLNPEQKAEKFKDLMAMSFENLMENGGLEKLKKEAPELYVRKFKEEYGYEPKD